MIYVYVQTAILAALVVIVSRWSYIIKRILLLEPSGIVIIMFAYMSEQAQSVGLTHLSVTLSLTT
jgi:hypothetical protein